MRCTGALVRSTLRIRTVTEVPLSDANRMVTADIVKHLRRTGGTRRETLASADQKALPDQPIDNKRPFYRKRAAIPSAT